MKVLHIISNLGSGGAEKLMEETLPIMQQKEGVEVELLLLTDEENVFGREIIKNNIQIRVIPLRSPRNPLNIYYIRKYIMNGNYDIVHVHLFPTFYWASMVEKIIFKRKPKFVFTEHSTHNRRRNRSYFKVIERIIYSSFDRIISISNETQERLLNWIKPSQRKMEKFVVINNGVNLKSINNASPYKKKDINQRFNDKTKLLCMVGRFAKEKDQGTIIRSMQVLDKDIHLLLVGEGELKKYYKELSKKMGVSDRVHFLGFRNDVERILKTSDINILSSHWEGLSLSSIEGMASGKPFVASKVNGITSIVGGAGILFSKGNYMELAKIINELLNNKEIYIKTRNKCMKRALLFDVNLMVEETIKLYNSLINNDIL